MGPAIVKKIAESRGGGVHLLREALSDNEQHA
jgi:hypothetical protein